MRRVGRPVLGLVGLLLAASLWIAPGSITLARFTDAAISTGGLGADTLAPPTGLAATGGSGVSLTWTPTIDTYATGYDVRRGTVNGGPYVSVGTITPGSASSTTDAPGNGTFYYVLRSTYQSWSSADTGQVSATVTSSTSTAFAACTTTAADTTGAGDNNGYQSYPARACVNDSSLAADANSGTGGTESCGTGATPDARKDRHRFWGYSLGLPGAVSAVSGIRVRADLGLIDITGTTNVCAQLSWNGGTSWTTLQSIAITAAAETSYTFGSAADTWGRSWTVGEFSTTNFRVRLVDASTSTTKRFDLDYVAVSVTYTP